MVDFSSSASSGFSVLGHEGPASAMDGAWNETGTLDRLRQRLDDQTESTDSLLAAVAQAARVLTSADSAALALHQNGKIVCRSRSGPIGPELGAPVNTDSGISGECLRSATILVSSDTLRDERVDGDVCRSLGIRSIAAVPLRGQLGMVGILEAFSGRPGAFENGQIDSLRALAEIAEQVHEREAYSSQTPASKSAPGSAVLGAIASHRQKVFVLFSNVIAKKDYRIIAAAAVVVVLAGSIAMWTSLHKSRVASAASEAHPASPVSPVVDKNNNAVHTPAKGMPLPGSRLAANRSDEPRTESLLHKAAELSPAADRPNSSAVGAGLAETEESRVTTFPQVIAPVANKSLSNGQPDEPPPPFDLQPSADPGALIGSATSRPRLPEFAGPVSSLTEAKLVRRVEPFYPAQARIQRLEGSVLLDATIAEDGTVRSTSVVSGPALLAQAATAAVRNWRYRPAVLGGKPTETVMRITVVFKLP
jgi:TonB family protein